MFQNQSNMDTNMDTNMDSWKRLGTPLSSMRKMCFAKMHSGFGYEEKM